jgi:hypothetical protein
MSKGIDIIYSSSKYLEPEIDVSEKHGEKPRKTYCKPRLSELGDLRDLTLGPTFGRGESGSLDQVHKARM